MMTNTDTTTYPISVHHSVLLMGSYLDYMNIIPHSISLYIPVNQGCHSHTYRQ